MNATNKVWSISDLVKYIGSFKKEMERAGDIQKLNETYHFQHLIYHIFSDTEYDSGIVSRKDGERLVIKICQCHKPKKSIIFEVYEKYKKKPYLNEVLILDANNALHDQRQIAEYILNENILLNFF